MSELFARTASKKSAPPEPEAAADNNDQSALWAEPAAPKKDMPPSYRVLARKYRPATFDQLIGQDAMVRTIANAIEHNRLPHAWMLTGVRGIGKTTTARIIARALNCTGKDGQGGPTVQPCGQCDSCRTITEDRHVDVLEMDAASRTGVDDIRDIIDGVRYGPVSARYKIYILDEVHMLSKNAFNALLKTLEEPPPHTKFIFATTEIRKVPVTVLSRCQRFDLRRIDSETLAKHFTDVAAKEKAKIEPEAVKLIAHAADGSVRDGLSLLDQAIARGNGKVSEADVKDMLGLADRGQSLALCRHLLRGEMKQALEVFGAMQQAGSDPMQVLQDMSELVHLLTRGQVIPNFAQDPSLPEYDRQLLTDLSDIKIPALARAWQILLKGITEVQGASHPAQAAEMVLIRLAYASELPPPADLIKQLRETAGNIAPSASVTPPSGGSGTRARVANGGTVLTQAIATQSLPQAEAAPQIMPTSFKELVALFVKNREGTLQAQLYSNVNLVRFAPGILEIRVGASAPANLASRLTQCLTSWTGQRWIVSISAQEGEPTLAEQDRAAEQKRRERAMNHPLVLAALQAFPDAKVTALRQKATPVVAADNATDNDEPTLLNDED
ncbi:MAG: DNA polymerase III subunit gamma/tau [Alphaproteobacteria bacterium]|nr:DNA polymerase III subunit gamma/tau [Alphaproteobacteria bacterium]